MARFVISGQAAADVNAYLEYNVIAGNNDGGKMLPEGEYKKLREDFIDKTSKQTNFIVHKQTKQKKLLGITDGENEPSGVISVQSQHPDFAGKQRGFVDLSKSEQDSMYNLFNKPFDSFQTSSPNEEKEIEEDNIPQRTFQKPIVSSIPKSSVPKTSLIPKKPTLPSKTISTSTNPAKTASSSSTIPKKPTIGKPTTTTTTQKSVPSVSKNSALYQKIPSK